MGFPPAAAEAPWFGKPVIRRRALSARAVDSLWLAGCLGLNGSSVFAPGRALSCRRYRNPRRKETNRNGGDDGVRTRDLRRDRPAF